MQGMTTIGLDLAKRVFQVHAIDQQGQVVITKRLQRAEVRSWFARLAPCLVGIECCASSNYWARELSKLGPRVKLIPPAYVKPYVRRQKHARADAAAICEAVRRPSLRLVEIKTLDQQAIQVWHRGRELLVAQQTQLINALRAHLAEFGHIFPQGNPGVLQAIALVRGTADETVPALARQGVLSLSEQLERLKVEIAKLNRQLLSWHRAHAESLRLATIPGIGQITVSAIVAAVGNGQQFHSAREFAAWIGLVPRQHSTGGKSRLGRISKQGNRYLRQLLVWGATSDLRSHRERTRGSNNSCGAKRPASPAWPWSTSWRVSPGPSLPK